MDNKYIKVNRVFNSVKKFAWLFVFIVAFAGLWEPRLGLLLIPVMFFLVVLSLFKGKYWCGNLCPHGSLFDKYIMPISRFKKFPKMFTSKITITLFFVFFMIMFSIRLSDSLQYINDADFYSKLGFVFVVNYFVVTAVGVVLGIIINPRAWCSICPMGTMETIAFYIGGRLGFNNAEKSGLLITDREKCIKCKKCARVCPMQLHPYLEFNHNDVFDNVNCIRCSTCVNNCPKKILVL
jgi:ferredoxin